MKRFEKTPHKGVKILIFCLMGLMLNSISGCTNSSCCSEAKCKGARIMADQLKTSERDLEARVSTIENDILTYIEEDLQPENIKKSLYEKDSRFFSQIIEQKTCAGWKRDPTLTNEENLASRCANIPFSEVDLRILHLEEDLSFALKRLNSVSNRWAIQINDYRDCFDDNTVSEAESRIQSQ